MLRSFRVLRNHKASTVTFQTCRALSTSAIMASDPIVKALQEFTTCDVSDALCKLKNKKSPNGGFLAGLTMYSPERQAGETKIVGPAYTVRYQRNEDPEPKLSSHYVG